MPNRQRNQTAQRTGLFSRGRPPHSRSNAHSVRSAWPYTKAVLFWFCSNILLLFGIASIVYGVRVGQKEFMIYGLIGGGLFLSQITLEQA